MIDREKVIEAFEMSYRYSNVDEDNTLVPQQLVLDAIALLKAQEPLWISVEDRLPTYAELHDYEVLVMFESGDICSCMFEEDMDKSECFGYWKEYFHPETLGSLGREWVPIPGVLYWMPMLSPPEEIQEDDNDD